MERHCPVCGCPEAKTVFQRDFSGMQEIVPFSHYDVAVCERCGAFFANHIEETMPLIKYYEQLSKYETKAFTLSESARTEYEVAIDLLQQNLNRQDDILDLGCGNGALLHMLQERGFMCLTGLEPSEKNCRLIGERWGIRAIPGALGERVEVLSGEHFDAVLLVGVLEHLLDVRENVEHAIQYLADGGILYLQVPDIGTFPSCQDLYQQFSVEHINFFSLSTLANLMRTFGMDCVSYVNDGCSLYSLWKHTADVSKELIHDTAGADAMTKYFLNAEHLTGAIRRKLAPYQGQSVYLWAAGTHTAMLYQLGLLNDLRVEAIIDSNVNYHGKNVYGVPVISPSELVARTIYPIVISSQFAQKSIRAQIIEDMGFAHEIVTLYE